MIHMNVEVFTMVMEVLGLVFGVLGAFVIFFGFMSEKNEGRFSGRLGQLYSFLNFRDYIIEGMLKFLYVLAACLCTGIGLFMSLTVVNLSRGLVLLIGGNLAVRIAFEFLMMAVKACRNLGEIGKEQEPVYERPERETARFHRRKKEEPLEEKLPPIVKKKADVPEPVKERDVKGEGIRKDSAQEDGRRVEIRKEGKKREDIREEDGRKENARREDNRKEMAGEAAVTEEINRKEVHRAEARNAGPEVIVQENKKPDRRIALLKSKYKVCPSCGEKCSSEFAFCNICGTKLP